MLEDLAVVAGHARVEPAKEQALVLEEHRAEQLRVDAQVGLFDRVLAQAGVSRQALDRLGAPRRLQARAARQHRRVFIERPLLDFAQRLLKVPLKLGRELLVVEGGRGVARQVDQVGQVGAAAEAEGLEVEDRGDEDDAVEVDAVLVEQVLAQGRGPGRPVALAGQELGAGPALVAGRVKADELADPAHVLLHAGELLLLLARRRPAEAGADGVDEDQVGGVEPGVLVVDQAVGRRWGGALVGEPDALRAGGP